MDPAPNQQQEQDASSALLESASQKEARFAALCQALKENHPETTEIFMTSWVNHPQLAHLTDGRALRLGLALRGNSNVSVLGLGVDHVHSISSMVGIAHYISHAENLKSLKIFGPDNNTDTRSVAIVDQLLSAASFNSNIQELCVPGAFGTHPLGICLSSKRNTLTSFSLTIPSNATVFEIAEANLAAEGIGALTALKELRVDGQKGCLSFMLHLLNQLREIGLSTQLQKLTLESAWVEAFAIPISRAIRDLLQHTQTVQEFVFFPHQRPEAPTESGGDIIFRGLHHHPSIRCVETGFFQTRGNDGTPAIARLLRNNQVLEKIAVSCHDLHGLCDILDTLIEDNSTLEYLVVSVNNVEDENVWEDGHARLLGLIPQINFLKSLELMIGEGTNELEPLIPHLVGAFELNRSLTFVSIEYLQGSDAEKTIDFYTTRNRFGPELAEASKAGMLSIFERMMANYTEPEKGLSVAFETLRKRDDWYEKITDKVALVPSGRKKKRRRKVQ